MDERLRELLNAVRKTAAEMGSAAQKTAVEMGAAAESLLGAAGQGASSLLSVGKLNSRAADLKARRGALLQEVGSLVYGTHTGRIADSEALLAKLREIDDVNRELEEIAAELARLRRPSEGACPLCGASPGSGDVFCRHCGARL